MTIAQVTKDNDNIPVPQTQLYGATTSADNLQGRDGAAFMEMRRRAVTQTPTCGVVALSTTATPLKVGAANLTGRHTVVVTVPEDATILCYLCAQNGDIGMPLPAGMPWVVPVDNDTIVLYAKSASGTPNVYVMELK